MVGGSADVMFPYGASELVDIGLLPLVPVPVPVPGGLMPVGFVVSVGYEPDLSEDFQSSHSAIATSVYLRCSAIVAGRQCRNRQR